MVIARGHDLQALERQLSHLAHQADIAARIYDRHDRWMWLGYAVIFLVIPFVVLLFRLHMEAWHYYVAGALFFASGLAVAVTDLAATAKRDEIIRAFERAQAAYDGARPGASDAELDRRRAAVADAFRLPG